MRRHPDRLPRYLGDILRRDRRLGTLLAGWNEDRFYWHDEATLEKPPCTA